MCACIIAMQLKSNRVKVICLMALLVFFFFLNGILRISTPAVPTQQCDANTWGGGIFHIVFVSSEHSFCSYTDAVQFILCEYA